MEFMERRAGSGPAYAGRDLDRLFGRRELYARKAPYVSFDTRYLMRFDCRRCRLRIAELQFPLFNLRILYLGEKNVRHIEGMPGP